MNIETQLKLTLEASRKLNAISEEKINETLRLLADETEKQADFILAENQKDLQQMNNPADPKYDRLKLTDERLAGIAADICNVITLPSPAGRILSETVRPNGMKIQRISVPFGVVGIIYEARPNVTFDVFSLCFKSGNACVLKGGSDAVHSNEAIISVIHSVLEKCGIDRNIVTMLPPNREATLTLLHARDFIDVAIPRGSRELIDYVRENSKIPIIETGAGICHTYFDEFGDRKMAREIVYNAKTRRPSVCNALDCLIIHRSRLTDLPFIAEKLAGDSVIIYADKESFDALSGFYPSDLLLPADENSFGTEFLSLKMAIKTVDDFDDALQHISKFSSKHSEAIISDDENRVATFLKQVDASSVYANASTGFTDGAQFGLGAEIGISTQKLHARGPMSLEALNTYKWIITGNGQIRPNS